jgi:NitT/TauT family transport system substrate-binding protein
VSPLLRLWGSDRAAPGLTRRDNGLGGIRRGLGVLGVVAVTLASSAAAEEVVVAVLPFVSSSPLFIAQERGYFEEVDLAVEFEFLRAAQPVALAVAAGDADFGATGLTAGFYNLAGSGKLRIIGAQSRIEPGYDFIAYLVSETAWEDGFQTLGQYPGKSVGITQIGSTFHYMLGLLAEKRGFALGSLHLKALESVPNSVAALRGGGVDSILLPAHLALPLERSGAARILGWVHEETPWQVGALFTARRTIENRRQVVERFVRAYQRGASDYGEAFLARHEDGTRNFGAPAEALLPLIQKYVPSSAEEILAGAPFIDPRGRLRVGDIYRQVAWFKTRGLVARHVEAGSLLDLSFIQGHFE